MALLKKILNTIYDSLPATTEQFQEVNEKLSKIQIKGVKEEHIGLKVLPGYKFNPILRHPRNAPCYCKSGLKFKKCCLLTAKTVVPDDVAAAVTPLVNMIRYSND